MCAARSVPFIRGFFPACPVGQEFFFWNHGKRLEPSGVETFLADNASSSRWKCVSIMIAVHNCPLQTCTCILTVSFVALLPMCSGNNHSHCACSVIANRLLSPWTDFCMWHVQQCPLDTFSLASQPTCRYVSVPVCPVVALSVFIFTSQAVQNTYFACDLQ